MVKKLVLLVVGVLMAALFAGCGNDCLLYTSSLYALKTSTAQYNQAVS